MTTIHLTDGRSLDVIESSGEIAAMLTKGEFVHLTKLDGSGTNIVKAAIGSCSASPDHPPGARIGFKQGGFVDVRETLGELEALLKA